MENLINKIFNCDCIEGMKQIPDGSVDCIITDPPFGTTDCDWDIRVDEKEMFNQFLRISKENAAIVIFSQLPFGSDLIQLQRRIFRYEWIYEKALAAGYLNSKKMPLRCHENILVFYRRLPTYNPQFSKGKKYTRGHNKSNIYKRDHQTTTKSDGKRYPRDCLYFNQPMIYNAIEPVLHPTQKPADLIEYLIKTYTNEGEIVLDPFMGSGTTAVAAINTNRNFIGFEADEHYFELIQNRIEKTKFENSQPKLFKSLIGL